MNNLDAVWAGLSTADRIVLLGHDNPLLSDEDKTRLATLAAAKADRSAAARPAPRTRTARRKTQRPRVATRR